MELAELHLVLPDWLRARLDGRAPLLADPVERMRFVIELARENVEQATGGPFAAGVFDADGRLVAPGVNLVTSAQCAILHAEMVAIALAQQRLHTYDLATQGFFELVVSADPCAMCFGAVPWSGVSRLVCAASSDDVRAIGFDEGSKPDDWVETLERRGIAVRRGLLREEATAVLRRYVELAGPTYNASRCQAP
ncbi:MAG: nucleoside deaminase [Ectothiorhodospiraceae bacterium]|jgi:tRNA(Arg) A34 adenosine deaminase TadA|nr:nucleoside deaminase [Ectothiorhodospiraceae bacterium]